MKKILLLTLMIIALVSCQNKSNKNSNLNEKPKFQESDSIKTERIFTQFKTLYAELLEFKDEREFAEKGFGEGGSYRDWLKRAVELKNNPDAKYLPRKGVVAGEIEALGLQYATSKGKETESTKFFNDTFSKAINPKPIEKAPSGNTNYDRIRNEYKLLGKWKIKLGADKYLPYEIYVKEGLYIGVWSSSAQNYKTETLVKKENNYYIKNNKSEEYYKLDSKLNMTLFDKDGELASLGCVAKKVK